MANASSGDGGAFGVTLCVNGIIVSGMISSGRAYFAGFAQNVATAIERDDPETDGPTRQKIHDYFAGFGELYPTRGAHENLGGDTEEDSDDDTKPLPEFIHLRNARILNGQTFIPTEGRVWWRGRISEVDGWILGTLGQ